MNLKKEKNFDFDRRTKMIIDNFVNKFEDSKKENADVFISQCIDAIANDRMIIRDIIKEENKNIVLSIESRKGKKDEVAQKTGRIEFGVIDSNHVGIIIMFKSELDGTNLVEAMNAPFIDIIIKGHTVNKLKKSDTKFNQWLFDKNPSKNHENLFHYLGMKINLNDRPINNLKKSFQKLIEHKPLFEIQHSILSLWLNDKTTLKLNDIEGENNQVISSNTPTTSRGKTEQSHRIGQGAFRRSLLSESKDRCMISGNVPKESLIASHIIPWSPKSDFITESGITNEFKEIKNEIPEEMLNAFRLNSNNGLILTAAYDSLFDIFLMTVLPDGSLKYSSKFSQDQLENLGIYRGDKKIVSKEYLTEERISNLIFHNNVFDYIEEKIAEE